MKIISGANIEIDCDWTLSFPAILPLEPRLMFDGALAADIVDVTSAHDEDNDQEIGPAKTSDARREIVIIDPSLPNFQQLVASLTDDVEVYILKQGATIDDVAAILSGMENIDAIHLLSHGEAGALSLGGQVLNTAALAENVAALKSIGLALSDDGDILLYGCQVAADGGIFIRQLSELTGADVAASDDLTGATALGADWDLEKTVGDIETSLISAERYDGVLATPVVGGGGNTVYSADNAPAVVVAPNVSISAGSGYGDGGTLKITITDANSTEALAFTTVSTAITTNGVVSVEGIRIYLGNGTTADEIGRISSTEDGTIGKTLSVHLTGLGMTTAISNGGFETGDLTNWTSVLTQITLGTSSIDGVVTPTDTTDPANSDGDSDVPSALGNLSVAISSLGKTTGAYALHLKSTGVFALNGYDVVHGPTVYSDSFAATAGQVMNFDWRALGGGDAYDVFGYIQKDDGTQTVILDKTGDSSAGFSDWATASVAIPTDGNYKFVFVSGTYDFSGGRLAGASLYIDNIAVYNKNPGLVTNAVVADIAKLVTYKSSSVDTSDTRTITFCATQKNGNSGTTTSTINGVVAAADETPPPSASPSSKGPEVSDTPIVKGPIDSEDTAPQTFAGDNTTNNNGLQTFAGGNAGYIGLQTYVGGNTGGGAGFDGGLSDLGGGGAISVLDGVVSTDGGISFQIPADVFVVAGSDSVVQLSAARSDGASLPTWLGFNSETARFTGTAPVDFHGAIDVTVTATDENGNQITTTFSLIVGGGVADDQAPAGDIQNDPAPDQQSRLEPVDAHEAQTRDEGERTALAEGRESFTAQLTKSAQQGRLIRQAALLDALQKAALQGLRS